MNIVIVDDDCLVSGALKTVLEAHDDVCVLDMGADGQEAVRLYRQYRPDVLLMDIHMEKMNGLDAAVEILRNFRKQEFFFLRHFLTMNISLKRCGLAQKVIF